MRTALMKTFLLSVLFSFALGSHFRFGTISWALTSPSTDPNTFQFTVQFVWRRGWFKLNGVQTPCNNGDTLDMTLYAGLTSPYQLAFGDGLLPADISRQTVTSSSVVEDWVATTWTGSRTYLPVGTVTSRNVTHSQTARLSTLYNNRDEYWFLQSTVVQYPSTIVPNMNTRSPSTGGLPIIQLKNGKISSYQVPSSDGDSQAVAFRMSTLAEQVGPPAQWGLHASLCPNISISTTGAVSIDARSLTTNTLFQTQHMLDDGNGGAVPIDYLINITNPAGFCSCDLTTKCSINSTCAASCGSATAYCVFPNPVVINSASTAQTTKLTPMVTQSKSTTDVMTWYFVADDTVFNRAVVISSSSIPTGASVSAQKPCNDATCSCAPGSTCKNPQYVTFSWLKPVVGTYSVCFGVTQWAADPSTSLSNGQYCVNIIISTQCNGGLVTSSPECLSIDTFTPARCCKCATGFDPASSCTSCLKDRYGPGCAQCPSCNNGLCSSGINGDGTCICDPGYQGITCNVATSTPCDPNRASFIQSQSTSASSFINPTYANLFMTVNDKSQGFANITFNVAAPSTFPLDVVIIQDNFALSPVDLVALNTPLNSNLFITQLLANYPGSQAGLAVVNNVASSYRQLGILTSDASTFASYTRNAFVNLTALSTTVAAYDAITSVATGNYAWRSNTYKVIVVMTRNTPTGNFTAATQAMAALGANVLFLCQSIFNRPAYTAQVASAGFGVSAALSIGQLTWWTQLLGGISQNVLQTTAIVLNDNGFFHTTSSTGIATVGTTGYAYVNFTFPDTATKGKVNTLPVATVAIMGWGTVTVKIVVNRAPVSQTAYYAPNQDVDFNFNVTGSDPENNQLQVRWINLPNNASLMSSGVPVLQNTFYNVSQVYRTQMYYHDVSVGQFQLFDGCDMSPIYNANFAITPKDYPPFTRSFSGSVVQGSTLYIDFLANQLLADPDPTVSPSSLSLFIASVPAKGQLLDGNNNVLSVGSRVSSLNLYYSAAIINNNYFYGSYNFSYYATDSLYASNISFASIQVNFTNHQPTLVGPAFVTVAIGSNTTFSMVASDVDAPDSLVFNSSYSLDGNVSAVYCSNGSVTTVMSQSSALFPNSTSGTVFSIIVSGSDLISGNLGTISVSVRDNYSNYSAPLSITLKAAANSYPTFLSASNAVTMTVDDASVPLTFVGADADGTQGAKLSFVILQLPINGTLTTSSGRVVPSTLSSAGFLFTDSENTIDTTASTSSYSFSYAPNDYFYGQDTVTVGIRDVFGFTNVTTVTINVPFRNHAPVLSGPSSVQGSIGVNTSFTFTVSDKDTPDNATIVLATYALTHVDMAWIGLTGGALTQFDATSVNLGAVGPATASYTVVLQLDDTARDNLGSITLSALDGYGKTASANLTVTLTAGSNSPPFFSVIPTVVDTLEDGNVTVLVQGSDNDGHQGGSLQLYVQTAPSFGKLYTAVNGQPASANFEFPSSELQSNTLVIPSTSTYSFVYVPTLYTFGNDTVTLYLKDVLSGVSVPTSLTFVVAFVNHPPKITTSPSVTCEIGRNCTITLYINDVDIGDSETLSVTSDTLNTSAVTTRYYSTATTSGEFTGSLTGLPTTSTVVLVLQLSNAASGAVGGLSLQVTDSHGNKSDIATVAVVTGVNSPPYIASQTPQPLEMFQNASTVMTITGEDKDGTQGSLLSIVFIKLPVNGTLTVGNIPVTSTHQTFTFDSSVVRTDNSTTWNVTYTPTPYLYGTDSFIFILADQEGGSSPEISSSVDIGFVNHPPTLSTSTTTVTCAIGFNCTIPLTIVDRDLPESESIVLEKYDALFVNAAYSIYNGDSSAFDASSSIIRSGMTGVSSASLVLSVDDNAQGPMGTIAVHVIDSHGDVSETLTIQISAGSDTPPFIVYVPSSITVMGDGSVFVNITSSDVDGNQGANLTFTLVDYPANGDVYIGTSNTMASSSYTFAATENTPSSAVINGAVVGTSTYGFTYRPKPYFSGRDTLSFYVSDALSGQTTITTIVVDTTFVDHPPVLSSSSSSVSCVIGGNCTFTFNVNDPDVNDNMTFIVTDFSLRESTFVYVAYGDNITDVTSLVNGTLPVSLLTGLPTQSTFSLISTMSSNIIGSLGSITVVAVDAHGNFSEKFTVNAAAANSNSPYIVSPDLSTFTFQAQEDGSTILTLIGSDFDGLQGSNLTLEIVDVPSRGTLYYGNDNTTVTSSMSLPMSSNVKNTTSTPTTSRYDMVYVPSKLTYGSDVFSFRFVDSVQTYSQLFTVSVNVSHVNHPPTGSDFSLTGLSARNISLANRFIAADPDSDSLQLVVYNVPTNGAIYSNGKALVNGDVFPAAEWDNLYYFCEIFMSGSPLDTVLFGFTDGSSFSQNYTGSISVTLSDRAPVSGGVNVTLNMNTISVFQLNATNMNPNQEGVLTVTILTTPRGSLCLDAALIRCLTAGSQFTNESSLLYYSPPVDAYGGSPFESFSFRATNPAGQSSAISEITMNVDYVNKRPIATFPAVLEVYEASFAQFLLTATDDHTPIGQLVYTLTVAPSRGILQLATLEADEAPKNFTSETSIPASLNGESNLLTFYPIGFDYGDNYTSFEITVTDSDGASYSQTVLVNVIHVNQPPTIMYGDLSLRCNESSELVISFNGTDMDTAPSSLVGAVLKAPQRGDLYACIYNETTDGCARGEKLLFDNYKAIIPPIAIVGNTTVWKAVFVPTPGTSQTIYAVPSFAVVDDYGAQSPLYTVKVRVVGINRSPYLVYTPTYNIPPSTPLALANITLGDPDAANRVISLVISTQEPATINLTHPMASSQCNYTGVNQTAINCTATQTVLRTYISTLVFNVSTEGTFQVDLEVNDLGAGADSDMVDISHLAVNGSIVIVVKSNTEKAATQNNLTAAIAAGSVGGAVAAAAAVAAVAKLVRKPEEEVFSNMFDWNESGVVDNPLFIDDAKDAVNPLYISTFLD